MDAVGIPAVISSATSVRNSLNYIICWILRAFLLFLSYDLLEDRRIADVISGIIWSFYYIKQIDSMLPCVCSVLDYRRQNVVTSVTHSPNGSCATFLFLPHLSSSVIYYWTYARQHGIYLLNRYPKTTLNRETDLSHFIPGGIAKAFQSGRDKTEQKSSCWKCSRTRPVCYASPRVTVPAWMMEPVLTGTVLPVAVWLS